MPKIIARLSSSDIKPIEQGIVDNLFFKTTYKPLATLVTLMVIFIFNELKSRRYGDAEAYMLQKVWRDGAMLRVREWGSENARLGVMKKADCREESVSKVELEARLPFPRVIKSFSKRPLQITLSVWLYIWIVSCLMLFGALVLLAFVMKTRQTRIAIILAIISKVFFVWFSRLIDNEHFLYYYPYINVF